MTIEKQEVRPTSFWGASGSIGHGIEGEPMTTSAEVIRRKYSKYLIEFGRSSSFISKEVAIFALEMALDDLEEVWRDEYACLERRVALATETARELGRELERRQETIETLRAGLAQVMLENDALEGELARLRFSSIVEKESLIEQRDYWNEECLKFMVKPSSSPTTASTEVCAPAAPPTSNTAVPTLSPPADPSSGESSPLPPARASSAPTSPTSPTSRRRRPSKRNALPAEEVGERTGLDPIDWSAALADVLPADARLRWKSLGTAVQEQMIYRIAETIHERFGTISQTLYDSCRPDWATSVASWSKTTNLKWIDVLNHLQVVPANLPLALRIVRSASS